MIGYLAVVAAIAGGLLVWAGVQPHSTAAASEEGTSVSAVLAPGQSATANFPASNVATYRTILQDTLDLVKAGDQAGVVTRIADLETAWDKDQSTLKPLDSNGWAVIDGQIDRVLTATRSSSPDIATESDAITTLLATLNS